MKIGVSGHRRRDGADWDWVRAEMTRIIVSTRSAIGYTSLAPGADQIFAGIVLEKGLSLVAVIPYYAGRVELEEGAKEDFDRFRAQAKKVIRVRGVGRDEAFMKAGRRVADETDRMIFVWDGEPSRGHGGTADIVAYALKRQKTGLILDPIRRTVRTLDAQTAGAR